MSDRPGRDPGAADDPGDPLVVGESEALTLLAHLVTSAELCMTEPYDYGVFRLIDAASRLAASMLPRSSDESRDFIAAFLADVDERKMWSTRDRERYAAFLRETSRRTAEHLVRVQAGGVLSSPTVRPEEVQMPAERLPESAETVLETIRARRVTRAFDSRAVTEEALLLVLEAGRWATSGGGRRIHPFLVVRDPRTVARLRAVTPGMFSTPPVVIVICTDATRAADGLIQLERDSTTMIDVGTAAMNMMVAAQALELGACPVTSFSHGAVSVVLGLTSTVEPELFVLLGHPLDPGRAAGPRRSGAAALPDGLVWWEHPGHTAPASPSVGQADGSRTAGDPTPAPAHEP